MSVHEQAQMRKRQADAMVAAQAWGLVVHACATRAGHPHAPEMMEDDLAALTESGGIGLVVGALGDLLGKRIGHQQAIDTMKDHHLDPSADHFVVSLADALAKDIDYDGQRAMNAQLACQHEAKARGIDGDALKQLDD